MNFALANTFNFLLPINFSSSHPLVRPIQEYPPMVVIGIHPPKEHVSGQFTVPCQVVTRVSCYLVTHCDTVTLARADDRGGPAPSHHPLIWTLLLQTNCW